jgi:hypothetical protein
MAGGRTDAAASGERGGVARPRSRVTTVSVELEPVFTSVAAVVVDSDGVMGAEVEVTRAECDLSMTTSDPVSRLRAASTPVLTLRWRGDVESAD